MVTTAQSSKKQAWIPDRVQMSFINIYGKHRHTTLFFIFLNFFCKYCIFISHRTASACAFTHAHAFSFAKRRWLEKSFRRCGSAAAATANFLARRPEPPRCACDPAGTVHAKDPDKCWHLLLDQQGDCVRACLLCECVREGAALADLRHTTPGLLFLGGPPVVHLSALGEEEAPLVC